MIELRPYQCNVIAECDRTIAAGKRRVILVAPTGAGKTIIGASIIRNAVDTGQHVLVLAHTREIIKQTSEKLFAHGIDHGIIQAGFMTRPDELGSRLIKSTIRGWQPDRRKTSSFVPVCRIALQCA